jgi:hypothetical protein
VAKPPERELNGYLQQRCCTYEMRQNCLGIGFMGGTIPFGEYEDSNFSTGSDDTGISLFLLWAASLLPRAEVRSAHVSICHSPFIHAQHASHHVWELLRSFQIASALPPPIRYRNIRTKFSTLCSDLMACTSDWLSNALEFMTRILTLSHAATHADAMWYILQRSLPFRLRAIRTSFAFLDIYISNLRITAIV